MSDYVIHVTPHGASILGEMGVEFTLDTYGGNAWACFYVWGEPHMMPDERREYDVPHPCRKHLVSERIESLRLTEDLARIVVIRGYEAVISDADDWSKQPGNVPVRYDGLHKH